MRHFLTIAVWLILGSAALAQDSRLSLMSTGQASRGWEAVGRIDIDGKGFCTGALITETLVLTAAHCLYDVNGAPIPAERFHFLAGLREGRADAYRNVRRAAGHPDYVFSSGRNALATISKDLALLELDQPIRTGRILPYAIASEPGAGDDVGVVSYAKDRADAPSLQEVCKVLGQQEGFLVMTCAIDFGASGSPVFRIRDGKAEIVSVVSAMAEMDGQKVSLGTSLTMPLTQLMTHFATVRADGQRVILSGQRNETGAKFIRP